MGNIADQYNRVVEEVAGNPAAQKTFASLMATLGITELTFDVLNGPINTVAGVFGLYLGWLMIKHRRLQIEKDQYEFQKIKEAQEVSSTVQAVRSQVQEND